MGRYFHTALVACVLVAAVASTTAARVPPVYDKRDNHFAARGVEKFQLVRKDPNIAINVARVSPKAPYELRAVPALNNIGDGLERTSAICARVRCVVATNGDFWRPGTDVPIGGVISRGRLLRSPSRHHAQITISSDGTLRTGPLTIRASLVPQDLRPIAIDAVNRPPRTNEIVLSTPAIGRSTGTKKGTVELTLRAVRPRGLIALHRTTVVRVRLHGSAAGNAMIPSDGAVLSGRGRGGRLLKDLLRSMRKKSISSQTLLRVESRPRAVESIGGGPVLVHDGKPVPVEARTNFVIGRHPRTMIGWTKSGHILLVTVDGRQPGHSVGMTLAEAARFMINLGAVDAVNLDGGGSTTFVERGKVVNRPSDRAVRTLNGVRTVHDAKHSPTIIGLVERPVAIALAVVKKGQKASTVAPGVIHDLGVGETPDPAAPNAQDPASDPTGSLPAIVLRTSGGSGLRFFALGLAILAVALAAAWSGYRHAHKTLAPRRL